MRRRVLITGLGAVTANGLGIDDFWSAAMQGQSPAATIEQFDASAFASDAGFEVTSDFKVRDYVPKSYRKATKVMARDIELCVAAADLAVRDAAVLTKSRIECDGLDDAKPTYESPRIGANIGAGLIAADVDELTLALAEARDESGNFDMHLWGEKGIFDLTPLWLLKYLPNMLACHVTILHDAQGPSNTVTCTEASGLLSACEAMRTIERGVADFCFAGGVESKINPMAMLRQEFTGRLHKGEADDPAKIIKPYDTQATGCLAGEGGAIVMLEAEETFTQRADEGKKAYAMIAGQGATQNHDRLLGEEATSAVKALTAAIRSAVRDADIAATDIDAVVGMGLGWQAGDKVEVQACREVFGERVKQMPMRSAAPYVGLCGAGYSALSLALAAKMIETQTLPAAIHCEYPPDGLRCGSEASQPCDLKHVLVLAFGTGGQNAAMVVSRPEVLS